MLAALPSPIPPPYFFFQIFSNSSSHKNLQSQGRKVKNFFCLYFCFAAYYRSRGKKRFLRTLDFVNFYVKIKFENLKKCATSFTLRSLQVLRSNTDRLV
jgi:hypothetical protein